MYAQRNISLFFLFERITILFQLSTRGAKVNAVFNRDDAEVHNKAFYNPQSIFSLSHITAPLYRQQELAKVSPEQSSVK